MKLLAIIAIIAVGLGIAIATINTNTSQDIKAVAGNNTIGELSIRGSAEKRVEPDMISLSVGVTTTNASAKDAVDENSKKMNMIIKALNENGISNDEMSTNYYSLYPIYSQSKACIEIYPPPEDCNIITGFRVSNTLTITTDISKDAGALIDLVVDVGASNIHGVNFFVSKMLLDNVKDELIEEAVVNAKERAELALKPLNMSIVGVKSINVDSINIPFAVMNEEAFRVTPLLPSEHKAQVGVNITFYIS
jgi:hypothetical protein